MYYVLAGVIAAIIMAALSLNGIWYGGDKYTETKAKTLYVKHQSEAEQIDGALILYKANSGTSAQGEDMELVNNLTEAGYLKEAPPGDWKVSAQSLYKPLKEYDIKQCSVMNKVAGFDITASELNDKSGERPDYQGCPPCSGAEGSIELADSQKFVKYPGCQIIKSE